MAGMLELAEGSCWGQLGGRRGVHRGCQVSPSEGRMWRSQGSALGRLDLRQVGAGRPPTISCTGVSGLTCAECQGSEPRVWRVQRTGGEGRLGLEEGRARRTVVSGGKNRVSGGGFVRQGKVGVHAVGKNNDRTDESADVHLDEIADVSKSTMERDASTSSAEGQDADVDADVDVHASEQKLTEATSHSAPDDKRDDVSADLNADISVSPQSDAFTLEGEAADYQPWLGAVLFRRSNVQVHYEFETTLERLDLAKLSSPEAKEVTAAMGVGRRAPAEASKGGQAEQDMQKKGEAVSRGLSSGQASAGHGGTPVSISCDVERDGRSLKLDGIIRTAITMRCRRCLEPVVERAFAEFNLLLSATPVMEPTQRSLGVVLGTTQYAAEDEEEGGGELDLDLDDKLYFPPEQREMDLSKYIRDVIHLEIPMGAVCQASCRGLCLSCGVNLNVAKCRCRGKAKSRDPRWGELEKLRNMMKDAGGKPGKDG